MGSPGAERGRRKNCRAKLDADVAREQAARLLRPDVIGRSPGTLVSPFRNQSGENWRLIRELDASAAVNSNRNGRTANPIAAAISGQALILAGLLLLRRP
jgi:hypothetical protein